MNICRDNLQCLLIKTFKLNKGQQKLGFQIYCLGYLNCQTRTYSNNNFIKNFSEKVKTKYHNLPGNSVIKQPESLVSSRMALSYSDVIEVFYGLVRNKNIQYYLHTPANFYLPGIYGFLSKDGLSYYIGSSLNMQKRYNRHLFNLKKGNDKRYSEANPKFYNYVNKYGLENLSFGCLLVIKNYPDMFTGFNISKKEDLFLTTLMQLDLLITEQFFLDTFGLSLNVAPKVGTRESSILSDETKKKMSDAHLNLDITLLEDKWKAIRAKAAKAWAKEGPESIRKKAISELHGRAVIIKDCNQKVIGEFNSVLKVAEHLGVNRNKVSLYLKSGNLLETKLGPVLLVESKENINERFYKIQVLDENRNILGTYTSLRATAKSIGISPSSLSATYLDQNKLWKAKYYFIKYK